MVDGLISGKPRLRGVSHEWAFFISLPLGLGLVISAPSGRAALAAGIYAVSVALLFGASALYHRITWASEATRRWMRRVDHSMIFVLIAGTYTPFALLALDGTLATAILIAVWVGAGAGIVMSLVWPDAPKWLLAVVYVALGWVAIAAFPAMLDKLGITAMLMVGVGGALYTAGAVIYALRRPNPAPTVFGYHEIFHALVIAAAALQYVVVAFYVMPNA
jgi:hemolysin III